MSEWHDSTLGQLADFVNGYPFKPTELNGRGLPVVRIRHLLDADAEMDRSDVEVPERVRIDDGDLIFSWSGSLASRIWWRGPALLNQHLFRVSERPGIDRGWLQLALEGAVEELLAKAHGTTMKHVTKGVLEQHHVLVPPMEEQWRIVDLIAALDAHDAALAVEVQAVNGFLQILRNELPEGEMVTLGSCLVAIDNGKSVLTSGEAPSDTEPRILKLSAVKAGSFDADEAKVLLTTENMPESARVHEGDVLITRSNTPDRVGFCARARVVPPDTYMPDLIWRLRPLPVLDPDYLEQVLASGPGRNRVTSTATGTSASMRKINKVGLSGVRIQLPSVDSQREFAERCLAIADHLDGLRAEARRVQQLRGRILRPLLMHDRSIPPSYDALLEST